MVVSVRHIRYEHPIHVVDCKRVVVSFERIIWVVDRKVDTVAYGKHHNIHNIAARQTCPWEWHHPSSHHHHRVVAIHVETFDPKTPWAVDISVNDAIAERKNDEA